MNINKVLKNIFFPLLPQQTKIVLMQDIKLELYASIFITLLKTIKKLNQNFKRYLDYISIATYDYTGPYDSKTGYNSPLYSRNFLSNSVVSFYFILFIKNSNFF